MADKVSASITIRTNPDIGLDDAVRASERNVGGIPFPGRIRTGEVEAVEKGWITVNVIEDKQSYKIPFTGLMADRFTGAGFWYGYTRGDVVLCHMGVDGSYYIINKIGNFSNDIQNITKTDAQITNMVSGTSRGDLDRLEPGDYMIRTEGGTLTMVKNSRFFAGRKGSASINMDLSSTNSSQNGTISREANQEYSFTSSGFTVSGVILRDKRTFDPAVDMPKDPRNINQWYKDLTTVNGDPSITIANDTSQTKKRNLPFVEHREVICEFSDLYFIESDEKESAKQEGKAAVKDRSTSRRARKEDVLSLSLISPNHLIESIKGTVADIWGNILDINRNVIPINKTEGLATLDGTAEGYKKVRDLHRRSLAVHWELNARKDSEDLKIESGSAETYANVDNIHKRNRSKLFYDIDKEGQIKFNIPSSSEIGNVPVLSRYENYTNVNPHNKDNVNDYDYLTKPEDGIDILLDSVGVGCVTLKGDDKLIPKDRITGEKIKLGTAFHDISTTCVEPLFTDAASPSGILSGPDTSIEDIGGTMRMILDMTDGYTVCKEITIDGEEANAGGRSFSGVIDGMINVSIGANTIDRQSMWLDTQGGMVWRVGSDKNGISWATQTDGDVYLQVGGGVTPTNDKRFSDLAADVAAKKINRFELRVMQPNGPSYTRILIDGKGVLISSHSSLEIRAEEDLILSAPNGNIHLNTEKIIAYSETTIDSSVKLHRQSRTHADVYEADEGARKIQRRGLNSGDI